MNKFFIPNKYNKYKQINNTTIYGNTYKNQNFPLQLYARFSLQHHHANE